MYIFNILTWYFVNNFECNKGCEGKELAIEYEIIIWIRVRVELDPVIVLMCTLT